MTKYDTSLYVETHAQYNNFKVLLWRLKCFAIFLQFELALKSFHTCVKQQWINEIILFGIRCNGKNLLCT